MRRFASLLAPLSVTLFALFTAQPLFVRQLTCSDDGFFHIAKAVSLEALIRAGHFFGRWSPQMAHGYGYPYFNYYGPLASYLLIALHSLGIIYPAALHLFLGLSIALAGLATYAFVREWWGDAAGVAAAVVYLTAPYLAFDVLYRAALAETFALVWPPVILYALHRALTSNFKHQTPNSKTASPPPLPRTLKLKFELLNLKFDIRHLSFGIWPLLSALAFAALMYTHNTTSLAVAPLAAGYVALLAWLHRDWRTLVRGGLSLAFGLALSARFWLPALAERALVQSDRLLVPPIFTYYTNFLSLRELLAPPAVIDPLLINPSPAKALGLVTAALALLGFAALVYFAKRSPRPSSCALRAITRPSPPNSGSADFLFGIWLLGFGTFYAFLTLAASRPLWDTIPLMPLFQFPWRMLGPATLCAAALAGAAVHLAPKRPWLIASAVALVAALGHLSWWYPRYCGPFIEITLARTIQYEYDTFTLGTTAKGEFLPAAVRLFPADNSLGRALINGDTPTYLTGLPVNSSLAVSQPDPLDYRAAVSLPSPTRLTFNQFYFPGWRAWLDGSPATIQLTPDTGLITVLVPAGAHTLRFHFGNTPIRAFGDALSLLSLLGLALAFTRLKPSPPRAAPPASFSLIPVLLATALIAVRPLFLDRTLNPLRHSAYDGHMVAIGQPVSTTLAGGLTVLSADYPAGVPSGGEFDVSLYLAPRRPIAIEYRPRFDLTSPDGLTWNNGNDALPPRWHKEPPPTPLWPVGQYAQWSRREQITPGTLPGDYALTATIFARDTLAPDSAVDADGNAVAPFVSLGTVRVTRPAAPPAVSDLNIQHRADYSFGPLTLLGYNLDRAEARPGDTALVTLFVRADQPVPDLQFIVGGSSARPYSPVYPTSQWRPGDVWRLQLPARIPAEAASGPYRFAVAITNPASAPFDLSPIQLTAPQRLFTAPPIAHPLALKFGAAIELAGYDLQPTADGLTLTLLWHALATPNADLSAFAHIEDASGRVAAQSDAVPADWTRPTTGWLPGEFVLDVRHLPALPAGEYTIYAGLADRVTGARVPTAEGDRGKVGVYKAP